MISQRIKTKPAHTENKKTEPVTVLCRVWKVMQRVMTPLQHNHDSIRIDVADLNNIFQRLQRRTSNKHKDWAL